MGLLFRAIVAGYELFALFLLYVVVREEVKAILRGE